MKKMNKVIVAMMTMALTFAMPAMAGNKKHHNSVKTSSAVTTFHTTDRVSVIDKIDRRSTHFDNHGKLIKRPIMKACTIKVSRHVAHKHIIAKAERLYGVMNARYNPRTREVTVIYDGRITSARHIMHSVA